VLDASRGESARRERAVAGLAVARDGLHEKAEHRAGQPVGQVAVPGHAVPPAEEAGAEDVVGAAAGDGLEDTREIPGVVLAVAVDVDGRRVPVVARDLETRAKSRAEAAAVRM
jgi:hypothetical protein